MVEGGGGGNVDSQDGMDVDRQDVVDVDRHDVVVYRQTGCSDIQTDKMWWYTERQDVVVYI